MISFLDILELKINENIFKLEKILILLHNYNMYFVSKYEKKL